MFEIKDGILKITKGDSAKLKVDLKTADGAEYTMQTGDTLTLTVRKKPTSGIMMQVVSGINVITLPPIKTSLLEVGSCCYDIQLQTANGDIFTVVGLTDCSQTNMVVYNEVTY